MGALPLPQWDASYSRRRLIQGVATAAGGYMLTAAGGQADAEATGYQISSWAGPVGGWSLLDVASRRWLPADLRGRAVLLNFWASWCEPCRAEMPALQRLGQQLGANRLLVLAINFKETAERATAFAASTDLSLPVLLDSQGALAKQWKVKIFPTTLMLDKSGRPRYRVQGEVDWGGAQARAMVGQLLF